jgi:NhaP-type Na+/H+ or K+/H+ antiporter
LLYAGLTVAGCGVLGVVYSAVVIRRARRQSAYQPVLEDWVWHTILPLLTYSALFVTGAMLEWSHNALFVLGAAVLLLVFIGIHNAWDTVTYMTAQSELRAQEAEARAVANPEARAGEGAARDPGPGAQPAPSAGSGDDSVA